MSKIATNKEILNKIANTGYLKYNGIYSYKIIPNTALQTCKKKSNTYNQFSYVHGLTNNNTNTTYNKYYNYFALQFKSVNLSADGTYISIIVNAAKSSHDTSGSYAVNFIPVHKSGESSASSMICIEALDEIRIPINNILLGGKINIFDTEFILGKYRTNEVFIIGNLCKSGYSGYNPNAVDSTRNWISASFEMTKLTNKQRNTLLGTCIATGAVYHTNRSNTASNRKSSESSSGNTTTYEFINIPKGVISSTGGVIDLGYFYNNFGTKVDTGGTSKGATCTSKLLLKMHITFYNFIDSNQKYILSSLPVYEYETNITSTSSLNRNPGGTSTWYFMLHYQHHGVNLNDLLTENILKLQYNSTDNAVYICLPNGVAVGKFISDWEYILACSISVFTGEASASISSSNSRDTALGIYRGIVNHTNNPEDIHTSISTAYTASPVYNTIVSGYTVLSNNIVTYETAEFGSCVLRIGEQNKIYIGNDVKFVDHANIMYNTQVATNIRSCFKTPSYEALNKSLTEYTGISNIETKCPASNVITPTYYNGNILLNKNVILLSNYIPVTNKLVKLDSIYSRNFPLKFTIRILDQPFDNDRSEIVNMLEYIFTFNSVAYNSSKSSYDIKYNYTPDLVFYNPYSFDATTNEYDQLNLDWSYFQGENLFIINSSDLRISTGIIPRRDANIIQTLDEEYDFYNYHSSDLKLSDISDNEILYAFTNR